MVFTLPNMKDKKTSSYLIKNTTFTIIAHELPREDQLRNYDHGKISSSSCIKIQSNLFSGPSIFNVKFMQFDV